MSFFKERNVLQPRYGSPSDWLYAGYSYGDYRTPVTYTEADQKTEFKARFLVRKNVVQLPYVFGKETFHGTNYKRPNVNYVEHSKNNVLTSLLHSRAFFVKNAYGTVMMNEPCWRHNLTAVYLAASLPNYVEVDFARRRAYWTMLPKFKGDVSLVNSILELKDFKQGLKQLASMMSSKNIDKVASTISELAYMSKSDYIKRTKALALASATGVIELGRPARSTELAANVILTTNLTVRPLLKDIAQIMVMLQTTAADAAAAFTEGGQLPHTSHYTETLFDSHTMSHTAYGPALGRRSVVKFVASMERTYSYTPKSAHDTFMKYWGLKMDWAEIWNALPFSFVADYFVNIGKSIERMKVDKDVDLNVRTYYESLKRESKAGYFLYHPDYYVMFWDDFKRYQCTLPKFITGYETSHYERYPATIDYGLAMPKLRRPSSMQQLNMMALARVFV